MRILVEIHPYQKVQRLSYQLNHKDLQQVLRYINVQLAINHMMTNEIMIYINYIVGLKVHKNIMKIKQKICVNFFFVCDKARKTLKMLFKWLSLLISQVIHSISQSIDEENIHWDTIVKQLNEDILLSIQRYEQMGKCFDEMKIFMQCFVNKQKKDLQHSSRICSINEWQSDKSTQTTHHKKEIIIHSETQLIDDVICKFLFQ